MGNDAQWICQEYDITQSAKAQQTADIAMISQIDQKCQKYIKIQASGSHKSPVLCIVGWDMRRLPIVQYLNQPVGQVCSIIDT